MSKHTFYNKSDLQHALYTCETDIEIQILANNLSLEDVQDMVRVDSDNPEMYIPLIDSRTIR